MLDSRSILDIGRVFIGRQREIALLEQTLAEALKGHARLVTLAGDPGIGKTRTALELTTLAQQQGAQVLWGWCYEDEGAPPYWPWVQSIRSFVQQKSVSQLAEEMGPGAANIAEIVPEIHSKLAGLKTPPTLEAEQARFRLFDSITTFLKNAASSQPLVLVLDDLQWADRSSLRLLQFLAMELSQPQSVHLLVVGCYRDVELPRQQHLLETLARISRTAGNGFQRVTLGGLDREDTARFIEASAGFKPVEELVDALFSQTEGNPFFITEVIRLLAESGELINDRVDMGSGLKIPEGVRDVIGQRLSRVSNQCKDVMATASIIGRVFDIRLLSDLSDELSEDRLHEVVVEASSFHLIESVTGQIDRFQFTHSLIQETLSDELTATEKSILHAQIAEKLEEFYGENVDSHAPELAFHFNEAQTAPDNAKLVRYSRLAGEIAIRAYAHEEAVPHFQRALAGKDGLPVDRETASILFGLGRSQLATLGRGLVVEAMGNLNQAFKFYADTGDVEQALAVAEQPTPTFGVHRTGVGRRIERALTMVPPDSISAGRLLALQGRILGQESGDYAAAGNAFRRALAIAQKEDNPALELRTLANASFVDFFHCRWHECLEKTPRIIELAKSVDDPHGELISHLAGAFVELFTGNISGARWHVSEGMPLAEKLHDRFSMCGILARSASASYVQGDWQSARDATNRGLNLLLNDPRLLNDRALLEFQVGNFEKGDAYMARLLESLRTVEPGPFIEYALVAASLPLISRIRGERYHHKIAEAAAEAVLSSTNAQFLFKGIVQAGLAWRAVDDGDVILAKKAYEGMSPLRGGLLGGGNLNSADYLLGLLANTMGDLELSAGHYEDALVFCREAGYRPELAWILYDYSDTLAARNRPGDYAKGMSLLRESLAISSELGMRPLVERVTARLDSMQPSPPITTTFPTGLSEREVEVLRLLASGKSNAIMATELVLSVRTVERHISNIYTKTNSHGRAEATAFAFKNGLISSD